MRTLTATVMLMLALMGCGGSAPAQEPAPAEPDPKVVAAMVEAMTNPPPGLSETEQLDWELEYVICSDGHTNDPIFDCDPATIGR